jgi:hypothetical protein
MNRTARTYLARIARVAIVALAVPVLFGVGAAFAQPYAADGGMQNASGSWDLNTGFCRQDPSGPGSNTRNDCRSFILSAGDGTEPGNTYYNALYDTSAECTANNPANNPPLPAEWTAGPTCTNYWFRADQTTCETNGGMWLTNICRGAWTWNPAPPASNAPDYRNNCTRCHNSKYMSGSAAGLGETFVMTGHKNMARPVVNTNTQYYTVGYPWSGANGVPYASDGTNPINWAAGTINVGGTDTELYWIYDGWIADVPRSIYSAGSSATNHKPLMAYSCGRCHTTGWTSDATIQGAPREPEATFPGITWDGVTPDTVGKVNLASGITGDPNLFSSWDRWGIQCSRCHGSRIATGTPDPRHTPNIPGKEATGSLSTGATRTALCMDCHRQETGGLPYDSGNTPYVLKVGPAHNSVEFVSHWQGNLFLNSPHGRFGGTFAQINDKTQYDTFFKNEGEPYPYQGNAGGCTQCHNVHKSTVAAANPAGGGIEGECTECHNKDLNRLRHPQGRGTPIEPGADAVEACEICHMPEGLHLFRINTSAGYTTFPVAAMTATVNANTMTHDGYTNAVWVDLDHSCGQCHGAGSGHAETTGTVAANSAALTVANGTGFVAGERVEIAGAGAAGADFETYVAAVAGNAITLAGKATTGVTDAEVVFNPTANGGGYMTRAELAALAVGMHDDKPLASFGYRLGSPDTLSITVDASGSVCPTACDAYSWNWGDGTANGSGVTATHTYAAEGVYSVTLTVTEYSVGSGSVTKLVKVYTPDLPPVVSGTCTFDANSWTETVTDTSTDDHGIAQVTVNWGDGTMISSDRTPPFGPFTHVFLIPGNFTLTHKAIDTVGQQASETCTANPAYFTVGGTVYRSNGTTPVGSAMVQIRKAGTTSILRTTYTNSLGVFSIGSLKPANYELLVTRSGYTFAVPAASATVGPNANVTILALSPLQGGPQSRSIVKPLGRIK